MATTKCSVSSGVEDLSFNKSNHHRSSIIAVTAADNCERETEGVIGRIIIIIPELTRSKAPTVRAILLFKDRHLCSR